MLKRNRMDTGRVPPAGDSQSKIAGVALPKRNTTVQANGLINGHKRVKGNANFNRKNSDLMWETQGLA